jgi:hypothetical protein
MIIKVYYRLGKKVTKGHGRARWKVEAESLFLGALNTYINLWEGKNLVIPNHQ